MKPDSIVFKRSRFERDQERYVCTAGELIRVYRHWVLSPERIHSSDQRQRAARTRLAKLLPEARFVPAAQATHAEVRNAPPVIALGDHYVQRVGRLLNDATLLGINSDPARSLGMLTMSNVPTFKPAFPRLLAGALPVEDWTRLEVSVDGEPLSQLAFCEAFIGEHDRCIMSRHGLHHRRKHEEKKSSGLLAIAGAGATGRFRVAVEIIPEDLLTDA